MKIDVRELKVTEEIAALLRFSRGLGAVFCSVMHALAAYLLPNPYRMLIFTLLLTAPILVMVPIRRMVAGRFAWALGYLWAVLLVREGVQWLWPGEIWSGAALGLASLPGIYAVINSIAGVKE